MTEEPACGGARGSGGGQFDAEPLPYLAPDDSQEFVQMADLFIILPPDASQGLQQRLPLHSQVLSRSCAAVAQMLASLADERSGAACSPAHPLDISTFFAGSSRQAALLFLACAYSPDAAPARLQAALDGDGGLPAVTGMLALAHRLDASRLLHAALDWAQQRQDEVYCQEPTLWLSTAAALQLDGLWGRLAAWAVERLREGPEAAAALLQKLDFAALPPNTAVMLLDGLAAATVTPPSPAAYERWDGAGSLCQHAAAAAAAAAAAEAAEAAQQAGGLDALFEAQQQQAAEDWDEGWDEAEADADEGEWDDGLPAHFFDGAHPEEEEGGPFDGLLPEVLGGVQLGEAAEGEPALEGPEAWPDEFEAWEQQQAAAQAAAQEDAGVGGWGEEFEAWEQQQGQHAAEEAASEAAWEQQPAGDDGAEDGGGGPAGGAEDDDAAVPGSGSGDNLAL